MIHSVLYHLHLFILVWRRGTGNPPGQVNALLFLLVIWIFWTVFVWSCLGPVCLGDLTRGKSASDNTASSFIIALKPYPSTMVRWWFKEETLPLYKNWGNYVLNGPVNRRLGNRGLLNMGRRNSMMKDQEK